MSNPVYSERILYTEVVNAWVAVSVPEDHRCVIKSIAAVNNSGAPAQFLARIHGFYIMSDLVPAATSLVRSGLHIVCYERETIQAYMYATNSGMSIHGYLFKDTGPRIEFPPAVLERPAPMPVNARLGYARELGA